jgi:manganese oxidase
MNASTIVLYAALSTLVGIHAPKSEPRPHHSPLPRVTANDNRRVAGTLRNGKLDLSLDIVSAEWFPEADSGPSTVMQAFAEEGGQPEIPGPAIRVKEGTEIHVSLHNSLPDSEVVVHGLHARPATNDDILKIPAGATREVTFQAGAPGTYFYWATSQHRTIVSRQGIDSQLSGAIIVDPATGPPEDTRTLMLGLYHVDPDSDAGRTPRPREIAVINGRSWPYTERFTFTEGDTVSWRVIDASAAPHPMHLHGFYFNIEHAGSEAIDSTRGPTDVTQANTRLLLPGGTIAIRFVPDRPGNWLFHCHLALHVDGASKLANILKLRPMSEIEHEHEHMAHGINEMSGLIIGIHVLPRGEHRVAAAREPQVLRLLIQRSPRGYNNHPGIGFVLQNGAEPVKDSVALPGPTLFLEKGRPARITVVNHLGTPTAVHWHGMEIESYPDGVAGWSGSPGKLAPMIQPNDSFIAEFTPPRAGTFIYHSHMNELLQSNSGMYGVLMVTDSAHPFDPRIDRIILVGGGGPGNIEKRSLGVVNGRIDPRLDFEAGTTYRLHIVQIHPQALVQFVLGTDTTMARWTPVAKDGADLPAAQAVARPAYTMMGPGETGDFLFTPQRPGVMLMSIHTRAVGWYVPLLMVVRPARVAASN